MPDQKTDEIAIFAVAAELSADAQAAFIDKACQGDREVRDRIARYLRSGEQAGPLDVGLPAIAKTLRQSVITDGVGTQLGPYKLLEKIGEGGMGMVFIAQQSEPIKRRVALKLIKIGMDTRQVIARFEAERQALAVMDHPSIAKVFDAGATESGRPYFVMELVNGIPITKFCDQQCLDLRQRLEQFIQVCHAVQHAHQKGIIHRDLKPSNVMVAMYDGRPVPKVIDFGVAKATGEQLTEKTFYTSFGQMVGTLEYMSPEQAQLNQTDVDTRSDIYSLGVILYELLTGEPPFEKDRIRNAAFDETLKMIREEEPTRPSTKIGSLVNLPEVASMRHTQPQKLSGSVRGDLDWIVMKALEKDRVCRYETADGFAQDIQQYLNNETVSASPPSTIYKFRKFALRNRVAIATALLVVTSIIIGSGISTWQALRATSALNEKSIALGEKNKALNWAVAQKAAAEQDFRLAHSTLSVFFEYLRDSNVEDAGSLALRQQTLLNAALTYYEPFLKRQINNESVLHEVAQGYFYVGLISAKYGSSADSLAAHKQSHDLYVELLARNSEREDYCIEAAFNLCKLAHLSGVFFRPDDDLRYTLEALDLMSAGYSEKSSWEFRARYALCLKQCSKHETDRDRRCQLEEQGIELLKGVPITRPSLRLYLGHLQLSLAHCRGTLGESTEAEQLMHSALQLYEEAASAVPPVRNAHQNRAIAHRDLGSLYLAAADFAQAKHHLDIAIEIYANKFSQAPQNKDILHGLVSVHTQLRELAAKQNQHSVATIHSENARQYFRALFETDKNNSRLSYDMAKIILEHALEERAAEKIHEASNLMQAGVHELERTIELMLICEAERMPIDNALSELANVYAELAELAQLVEQTGGRNAAAFWLKKANLVRASLVNRYPTDDEFHDSLTELTGQLANMDDKAN